MELSFKVKPLIREDICDGCFSMKTNSDSQYSCVKQEAEGSGWNIFDSKHKMFALDTDDENEVEKYVQTDWVDTVTQYFDSNGNPLPLVLFTVNKNYHIMRSRPDNTDRFNFIISGGKIEIFNLDTVQRSMLDKKIGVENVVRHIQKMWDDRIVKYIDISQTE